MILIGFMGAGKTSVGKALSESLNQPFLDLDQVIIKDIQMPISDYFSLYGEDKFRQLEQQYLEKFHQYEGIVSTGGGCVETIENRELLKLQSNVIYLKAEYDILLDRIVNDSANLRPIAQQKSYEDLKNVYDHRLDYYQACASHIIETDRLTTEEVVQKILKLTAKHTKNLVK